MNKLEYENNVPIYNVLIEAKIKMPTKAKLHLVEYTVL